jgi:hypothetical protein
MPQMDGFELLRHTRIILDATKTPAIAVSAHAGAEEQARQAGFQGVHRQAVRSGHTGIRHPARKRAVAFFWLVLDAGIGEAGDRDDDADEDGEAEDESAEAEQQPGGVLRSCGA